MEDIRQQLDTEAIRQSVQDGSYYRHARDWYDELYHRPIAERSYFIVLMGLAVITIFFSTIVYFSMQPLRRIVPYTIYSKDIAEERPVITRLRRKPAEDLNLAMGRFLIEDYLIQREKYVYDVNRLEWQFNRIRRTSVPEEFQRYQAYINPENPGSPFTKYGRSGSRRINIYNTQLNLKKQPQTATVYFTTTVEQNKQVQQNNWVANITFRFPELKVNQNTVEVLQWNPETNDYKLAEQIDFKVERYFVQEISGG